MAHAYPTLKEAKAALHRMGEKIIENGTPKDFGPLVYAFTGAGNVTNVSNNGLRICVCVRTCLTVCEIRAPWKCSKRFHMNLYLQKTLLN